jgi:hypothetical protein
LLELVNGQLVGDIVREKNLEIFTGEEARNSEHRLEGARERESSSLKANGWLQSHLF